MYKRMIKGSILGLAFLALLFALSFCMVSHRANSLPKSDKLTTARSLGQAFVEVAKKVQPAVVNVTTEKTITMKPWERFGDDFFKGSPFEDFFRGFGSSRERGKEYRQKQRSGGSGGIVEKKG